MQKVTYASLGTLGEEFHREFEVAAERFHHQLGRTYPMFIGGKAWKKKQKVFVDVNPSDTRVILGKFPEGTSHDARRAIAAARAAFPSWKATDWQQRVVLLRKAADLIAQHQMEFAVLLSMETGKNRFEAIAEVSETVDLILYYCRQMEEHRGYFMTMQETGSEQTRSILKPYGVWVVIVPFNFPMALGVGMATGALVAGNTVVFKPASDAPLIGLRIYEMLHGAGLTDGVFNFVTGAGRELGKEFLGNPDVDGLAFTGSRAVGMNFLRRFRGKYQRPCIIEMGGKNPTIVMPSAHLDDATEGIFRSAFGMGGQKCSACSRLYLHHDIYASSMELLVEKTKKCRIGNALARETFLGPLINGKAVQTYQRAILRGRKEGHVVTGGAILKEGDFAHGYFVEPTIIDQLLKKSIMFQEEYFVPILAVAEVRSLEEAITLANQSDYGLTAGIFTEDKKEQQTFFEKIEAGVAYSNRRGGATTGAWPGVQSFGGWKGSGSTGKNGLGPYYVSQFMREQSQTVAQKLYSR